MLLTLAIVAYVLIALAPPTRRPSSTSRSRDGRPVTIRPFICRLLGHRWSPWYERVNGYKRRCHRCGVVESFELAPWMRAWLAGRKACAMNCAYPEILAAMGEPKWWNEYAAPRYVEFTPREAADIYADEVALVLIECQDCGREFRVCFSRGAHDLLLSGCLSSPLDEQIRRNELHYGDPPNVNCCPAGATMNSVPVRVLEYWEMLKGCWDWSRNATLEIEIGGAER